MELPIPEIPFLPLAAPLQGRPEEFLSPVLERLPPDIKGALRPGPREEVRGEPVHFVLMLTGGTERELLEFSRETEGPFVILSHPAQNSLAAALEAVAKLRAEGRRVVLHHLGDPACREELERSLVAAELARRLKGKRVGIVGEPSPWLVASVPPVEILERKLGLEPVRIPLEEVVHRAQRVASPPRPQGERVEPGEEELAMGGKVYSALRGIVEERDLSAFTIACFGLLPHRMTACWALARLGSEGTPAGCEGDLTGLIALIISQEVTGSPGFLANPVDVDPKRERLLLAHCTAPFALLDGFRLRTHFESRLGLAVEGALRKGPYTLVRFGGERLEQGFFVEGNVLPERPGREDICRTQVIFKAPKGALQKLLREPLGNHHVLIPGHHRAVLERFHQLFLAE